MTDQEILEHLDHIYETLSLHNKVIRLLLNDSIAKDEKQGIFRDMDEDINKFFQEALKKKDD